MTAQDKALKENTASAPLQIVAPGTCVETGEQATLVLGMYDHLVETIHQYNPSADFAQIDKAFRYADTHHNGQLRKDGSPFITHPLAVAQIIAKELRLDSESIEAALMHDCIEDTSATYAEIAKEFSPAVADLVEGVSKLTRVQYASKEEEQMENLRKMLMAMAKDIRVILIKLADRTHNMRTMEYQTAEKQRQKSLETMEIYAPIAHRLGMQRIKWELEDLSLKYLDPVGYDEITRSLEAKQSEHEAFMERVQTRTGWGVMLYTDAWAAKARFGEALTASPIWVANYGVKEPEANGKWASWAGFQYSDRGTIPGISGRVDLDWFTKDAIPGKYSSEYTEIF